MKWFLAIMAMMMTSSQAFVPHLSSSSSSSSLYAFSSSSSSNSPKKSIRDRTPQEWQRLVQSMVQAVVEAGPRAGPVRTLQGVRALQATLEEYLPNPRNQFRPAPFEPAKALRQLFERLGATYIKLGQFVASSPTLFPPEYVTEFQKCLDQTETLDFETKIKPILKQELGQNLNAIFESIDPIPLASASIAQVHKAVLKSDGSTVVLKVQKPGIDSLLKADLGFLKVSSELLEFVQPDWERTSLKNIASDIQSSMLEELDFVKESRNLQEFSDFLQREGFSSVATAPRVYPKYTTRKVLVMEYLDGVSLLDTKEMTSILQKLPGDEPKSLESTIVTALNVWTTSVQTMPWFHADVHAGNLLLLKQDGRVGFLDFGIVGKISGKTFTAVTELSQALTVGNYTAMAVALSNMGATSETVDIEQFASDLEQVTTRLLSVQPDVVLTEESIGVQVESEEITNLVLDFVKVTENNGLRLPREFGLLVKQSLYFDRYLKLLAPGLDVMDAMTATVEEASLLLEEDVNGGGGDVSKDKVVIDV